MIRKRTQRGEERGMEREIRRAFKNRGEERDMEETTELLSHNPILILGVVIVVLFVIVKVFGNNNIPIEEIGDWSRRE